jgi:DNA-binding winged helix-turn-helix (wHTH) protein/tetratricopeptide (TPR) repeat protein
MIYGFNEYLLNTGRRELRRGAALITAEPQTFDLLLYLIQNRERVVSKDDLMAAVWSGRVVSDSTLSSQIAAVRHAIGDDGERQILVRTLARKGFRFVGAVQEQSEPQRIPLEEAASAPQRTEGLEAKRNKINMPERRQLSVMICNLVGGDARSSTQDPEDLLAALSAYHDRIRAVIAEHDGFIAKSLGNDIVVYFGYPCAREDDAERAARAGLAVVKTVAALRPRDRKPLQARVAIANGLVVIGDLNELGISADHAAIGDALPLAAGLVAFAEPGSLIVSATTHRLIGALFDYRDLGLLNLKSIVAPVEAWQVLGEGAATTRFKALRSETTKLIGREEEFELLRRRWNHIKSGEGRLALIHGEPGIGKSRLVFALQESIGKDPHHCLWFQCSPHRIQTALYPVINQLEHAAGLLTGDSDAIKLGKLKALLASPSQSATRDVALFAELLSIASDAGSSALSISLPRRKELMLEQLVGQIAELAAQRPVLIVLEDAHWIDPTTLELFDVLVERIRALPVLLIITYRPEFTPPWLGESHVTALTLNRLGRRDNIAVIRQVARGKEFPPVLLEQIVTRSDGVPLFIEEVTKSVLESDILREENGSYVLADFLQPLAVPTTLQASLVARLDRLASPRAVVQAGATLGRDFAYTLIRAVCDLTDDELEPLCKQLVASELVHQRGVVPHAVYTFKHALVQDAAYGTMLKSQRIQMHARIVETFERQFPEMLERNPDVLAYHCTEAGIFGKAIDYWLKSTRKSLGRSAGTEAQAQLEKAVTLLQSITDRAARQQFEALIQVELGNTFVMTKGFASPDVATALRKARGLLDEAAHPIEALRALGGLCNYHLIRSEAPKLLPLAEPFLRRRADPLCTMIGHYEVGTAYLHIGRFEDAERHLEKGLSLYDEESSRPVAFMAGTHVRAFSFVWLSFAYLYLGKLKLATETMAAAVSDARSRLHPFTLVSALLASARLLNHTRNLQAAIAATDEGFAIATEQRSPYHISRANILKAVNVVESGWAEEGISLMDRALVEHRKTGANFQSSFNLSCLADAYARAGSYKRAIDFADQAIQEIERTGERWWAAEAQRIKGKILLAASADRRRAENCFRAALKSARSQKARFWELRAALSLAGLWNGEGRDVEARKLLAPIYAEFTDDIDLPDLNDARQLLDRL